MADTTLDDVYDDPDNILADVDDSVTGATELPKGEADEPSQSIFTPELGNDERGRLDFGEDDTAEYAPGVSRDDALDAGDEDATRLSDVVLGDEQDGTNS